ncbi:hypothetical protein CROQUDRAFT_100338 [Cronartium quercuum f. sp. fusiforme G11]|uniref:Uncharacterized protein n=1 Tax=Cronartium quercuum f. sp. fusiforme G11 TaxID=708437 RepID=A0A9P6N6V2_9BASI|nr:hypothetical protein CROQUDRAFT_100338 [Cronartium quercuum f. sp. fusiforme G11]
MPANSPENDWKSTKFQAGLPMMVKNARDCLKDDGSNYADWEYCVTQLIKTVTGKESYLDDLEAHLRDLQGNRVIFSIINLLVPVDIGRCLSGLEGSPGQQAYQGHGYWHIPSQNGHEGHGPGVSWLQVDKGQRPGHVVPAQPSVGLCKC